MATKAQKIRLALFFVVSGSVLAFFLVYTAGSHLLKKREFYFVEFDSSVGGLRQGAQVKYQGFKVGRVEDLSISAEDITTVVVEISVQPDMIRAIKADTRASLYTQGITGIKYIELTAGTQEAEVLAPGSTIPVSETFLSDIDRRAEILTNKIEEVLNNVILLTSKENSVQFNKMLRATGNLMENADHLLAENRDPIHQTFENLAHMTRSLDRSASTLQATMDSLHQMLTGEETHSTLQDLQVATRQVRQQLEGPLPDLIANMNKMSENIDKTFTHIDLTVVGSRKNILDALQELEETLQNVREATELIREDPSVLIRGRGGD